MPANYINTLVLTLDPEDGTGTPTEVQCQGTNIALIPRTEGGEVVQTFCPEPVTIPGKTAHDLHVEGLQDWGMVDGLCGIVHAAWKRGIDNSEATTSLINYVLTVGAETRTGQVQANTDLAFGGAAGSALTFTVDLPCVGTPEDGVVTP